MEPGPASQTLAGRLLRPTPHYCEDCEPWGPSFPPPPRLQGTDRLLHPCGLTHRKDCWTSHHSSCTGRPPGPSRRFPRAATRWVGSHRVQSLGRVEEEGLTPESRVGHIPPRPALLVRLRCRLAFPPGLCRCSSRTSLWLITPGTPCFHIKSCSEVPEHDLHVPFLETQLSPQLQGRSFLNVSWRSGRT